MNQFEDLKSTWQRKQGADLTSAKYSTQELDSIFELRTKRLANNINSALRIDAILMVISASASIISLFMIGGTNRVLDSLIVLCAAIVLLLLYRFRSRSIDHFAVADSSVRQKSQDLINRMQKYIRSYLLLIPTLSSALYIILILRVSSWSQGAITIDWNLILKIAPVVLIAIVAYFLTKTLAAAVFGKSLSELRQAIYDLDYLDD